MTTLRVLLAAQQCGPGGNRDRTVYLSRERFQFQEVPTSLVAAVTAGTVSAELEENMVTSSVLLRAARPGKLLGNTLSFPSAGRTS